MKKFKKIICILLVFVSLCMNGCNKRFQKSLQEEKKIADSFELPKDIVLGIPIVTCYGSDQMTIENHKGILEFNDKYINVRALDCTIKITGRNLEIKEFAKDIIIISGCLESIHYEI